VDVATEPLVDLSTIDLSQVEFSPEDLDDILPHRGHMRHLNRVVSLDRKEWIAVGIKEARDDEFWVEGHIPGRPLFPGVLMLESAAQLSSVLFRFRTGEQRFVGFVRCDNVAFRGTVVPGDDLILVAKATDVRKRRFITVAQGYVKDVLTFEATITGMVV
jgi:3-hydroxyacyl-[acyl-carrier-protein] dehydratase